jgi:hypothetical protein
MFQVYAFASAEIISIILKCPRLRVSGQRSNLNIAINVLCSCLNVTVENGGQPTIDMIVGLSR